MFRCFTIKVFHRLTIPKVCWKCSPCVFVLVWLESCLIVSTSADLKKKLAEKYLERQWGSVSKAHQTVEVNWGVMCVMYNVWYDVKCKYVCARAQKRTSKQFSVWWRKKCLGLHCEAEAAINSSFQAEGDASVWMLQTAALRHALELIPPLCDCVWVRQKDHVWVFFLTALMQTHSCQYKYTAADHVLDPFWILEITKEFMK